MNYCIVAATNVLLRSSCTVGVAIYIHCKPFRVCISVRTAKVPPDRQLGEKSWRGQKCHWWLQWNVEREMAQGSPSLTWVAASWRSLIFRVIEWSLCPEPTLAAKTLTTTWGEVLLNWLINQTLVNLPINTLYILFVDFQFPSQRTRKEQKGSCTPWMSGRREKCVNQIPTHTALALPPTPTQAHYTVTELETASPSPRASPNWLTAQSCIFLGYLINLPEM